jgi:hypothetical protein
VGLGLKAHGLLLLLFLVHHCSVSVSALATLFSLPPAAENMFVSGAYNSSFEMFLLQEL